MELKIAITIYPEGVEFPSLKDAEAEFYRWYLLELLVACKGNRGYAAKIAGVHRNTLTRLCEQYEVRKGKKGQRKASERMPA